MIEISSDFNFILASWFLGNVHVKPNSTHSGPLPAPLDFQIFLRSWVVFCQLFRCLELWWITFSVCVVYYCSTIKICWLLPDVFEFRLLISPTPFSHAFELGSSSYTYYINSLLEFLGSIPIVNYILKDDNHETFSSYK